LTIYVRAQAGAACKVEHPIQLTAVCKQPAHLEVELLQGQGQLKRVQSLACGAGETSGQHSRVMGKGTQIAASAWVGLMGLACLRGGPLPINVPR